MMYPGEADRRRRRRMADAGLTSITLRLPVELAGALRDYALVTAAIARTGGKPVEPDAIRRATLAESDSLDLEDPTLSEQTRRALGLLLYRLGRPLGGVAAPVVGEKTGNDALGGEDGIRPRWQPPEPSGRLPSAAQVKLAAAIAAFLRRPIATAALDDRKVMSSWISFHQVEWKAAGSPLLPEGMQPPDVPVEG